MTGLECLRNELSKRGCTSSQINSKIVAVVLDVLSKGGTINTDEYETERKIEKAQYELTRRESNIARREMEVSRKYKEFQNEYSEAGSYIKQFRDELEQCETAEGRDAMRRAQLFINTVDVDTCYDNTAYIIGLASILENGNGMSMKRLKKINPKLFSEKVAITFDEDDWL